jgi:hypothetical protein
MQTLELQILQSVLSLLVVLVGSIISAFIPKLKATIDAHLGIRQATIVNHVIDGLASISEAVVQDFNQRVVLDAKKDGVFSKELAKSVKGDAIKAVMTHGSFLLSLSESTLSDVTGLISTLIEQSVAKNHVSSEQLKTGMH